MAELLKEPDGQIVTNTQQIDPSPSSPGPAHYPENLVEKMKAAGGQGGRPGLPEAGRGGRLLQGGEHRPDGAAVSLLRPARGGLAEVSGGYGAGEVLELNKKAFELGQECLNTDFRAGGFRRLRAATYFAHGGKVGKTPRGTAPDEHSVLIVAFPRTPLRGLPLGMGGKFPARKSGVLERAPLRPHWGPEWEENWNCRGPTPCRLALPNQRPPVRFPP